MGLGRGSRTFESDFAERQSDAPSSLQLEDGARVAVVGGGPAGSFFSYFLLDMAERMGTEIGVDIYDPSVFSRPGPASCNHCGGIISESLVQILATDGINLPTKVVQRGIDAYVLHTDRASTRIETPLREKRIAAVHRGGGPRGIKEVKWDSFDGFLQELAVEKGAHLEQARVEGLEWVEGRPQVAPKDGIAQVYDLVVGAVGVNTNSLKLFEGLGFGYQSPETTKTYICEFPLGQEMVQKCVGNAMHVFLFDLPRLEFAALIPKGDYLTVCLMGEDIDNELVEAFLDAPEVKKCLPPGWQVPKTLCHCAPRINIRGADRPFRDRVVMIGDCGVTKLYKDGIGAAYRTAKAAATTAVFEGVSSEDFKRHYWPVCKAIGTDNVIGKGIFAITRQIQKRSFASRAVLRMAADEQQQEGDRRRMSTVLWDTFTGSAPYRDVLRRTFHPAFAGCFLKNLIASIGNSRKASEGHIDPLELLKSS